MLTVNLILDRLDSEGRLIECREQLSRSFVIQLMRFLKFYHDGVNAYGIQDITNTTRTLYYGGAGNIRVASCGGHAGVAPHDSYSTHKDAVEEEKIGIQVGTGTTAPTPIDYALETRITHGQGAGQFEYGGTELLALSYSAPDVSFTIRRYFTNASGGSITVNEVGIYAQIHQTAVPRFHAACIARDGVSPGITVLNGEILRVTYVPQITV